MKKVIKIGITGHRDLLNESEVRNNIFLGLSYFKQLYGNIVGLTAIASGADTVFAQEIKHLNGTLNIILPFSSEEYRNDFINERNKREYDTLIINNTKNTHVNNGKFPLTSDEKNEAYLAAGKRIVDESDLLFAVWDGRPASGKGGTADIVAYAKAKSKEIHLIKGLRDEEPINQNLENFFDQLDKKAIRYKKRIFVPIYISGLITALVAVICFASGLTFLNYESNVTEIENILKLSNDILELLSVGISFCLLALLANKWKYKFLIKRRATEYLRILLWFKNARIPIYPLENVQNEKKISEDIDFNKVFEIEMAFANDSSQKTDLPNAKRMLWALAHEQIIYHEKKRIKIFSANTNKMQILFNLVKSFFLVVIVSKFSLELMEHYGNQHLQIMENWCTFLVIVLPSVYTTIEGIKYFGDWKQKIKTSKRIVIELMDSKNRILNAINDQELETESKMLRNILDRENADWYTQYSKIEIEAKV